MPLPGNVSVADPLGTALIGGPHMTVTQPSLVTVGDARLPVSTVGPARHIHSCEDEAIYVASGVLTK
jgi:hypothetical protein